ncbi:MAG: methyltransferase domain-containing protein [Legionellales bacterium]|nr:methyltransferase domain-containing protein [Legionellales bacterium]
MNKKIIQSAVRAAQFIDQIPWMDQLAERFMERFDWFKFQPRTILCLGAINHVILTELSKRFTHSQIHLADVSSERMQAITASVPKKIVQIQIDSESLPLVDQTFDLIVSYGWLQWCYLPKIMPELFRILKADGLLMFTTLGPDSLQEVKQSWAFDVGYHHVNDFVDMHDMGDLLLAHGFVDPVMDVELFQVQYQDMTQIMHDLKHLGSCNIHPHRAPGLVGKTKFAHFSKAYQQLADDSQTLPLSWEIIYGHAWMPNQRVFTVDQQNQEVVIPLTAIGRAKSSNDHDEPDDQ